MHIETCRAQIFLADQIFSSMVLKDMYEPCEFENKHVLPFVDILYVDAYDSGDFFLASCSNTK